MAGIYIHIPFCKQACSYCDFYFVTRQSERNTFVQELIREINVYHNHAYALERIETIYIGGGTPSLLTVPELSSVFEALHRTFNLSELKEVTLEMNPDDVTPDYLRELKALGINRSSMGVQSFDDQLLSFMNRTHNSAHALQCLHDLAASEFDTFTVDLIYGNPGQSLSMLEKDIDTLLRFDPPHISAYSLTVEDRTRLGKQVELGKIQPPSDEETSRHFDLVINKLRGASIFQYEVSNYAASGHEAIHNSNYWGHKNYIGFGPGAHSFWWDHSGQIAKRWSNKPDLKTYLKSDWKVPFNNEMLDLATLAEEHIMLKLRTRDGINISKLYDVYGYELNESQTSFLSHMRNTGYIENKPGIVLTQKGLHIADSITVDLLSKK